MTKRRALLYTLLGPPLCGVLVATLVMTAWLAMGQPRPLAGDTWFRFEVVGDEADYTPAPDEPVFFLVVGGDAREGGPSGSLADAIHVVGVNPAQGVATVLGIPRDLAVPIPGSGTNKINSALSLGGLELQARTVSDLVGIEIQYAIATAFEGFIAMVEGMGGIDIDIHAPMHDFDAGTSFDPGPLHLDGHGALAYARDRKSFPAGDIARSENHGRLMIAALSTLQARGTGAANTLGLLATLGRHTELQGATFRDLYQFARLALTIDPAAIRHVVVPTGGGAGSDLSLGAGAPALFEDFRDDAILQNH